MFKRNQAPAITLPQHAVERPLRLLRLAAAVGTAALAVFALSALAAGAARADELRMEPITERGSMTVPVRGMTMDRVRNSFGQPSGQRSAVGDPPITRWEYDGFVVYFEYQYVLHTVVKRGR
ncbi:MAG: hypothetical protein AAF184_04860 [Pseudomonadota bacterium]